MSASERLTELCERGKTWSGVNDEVARQAWFLLPALAAVVAAAEELSSHEFVVDGCGCEYCNLGHLLAELRRVLGDNQEKQP